MAYDWTCTKCGVVNDSGAIVCEACGRETSGKRQAAKPIREGYQILEVPTTPPPCTAEQNKAALRITLAVFRGEFDAAEGTRRLAELFQMPELVNG